MSTPTWPAGRPRVLVTDGWLTNAGDAAIALATQQLVERHAPGAAVLHAAYGAEAVGDRYPALHLVPPLEALVGTRWREPAVQSDLVTQADLLVSQGGGFLREEYEPWSRLDALDRAAATGVPLLLLGQTIGRFDRAFARRSLRSVLRAAAVVVVRDPASVLHAVEVGAEPDRVVLGTDVALHLASDAGHRAAPDAPIAAVLSGYAVERGRPAREQLACDVLAAIVEAVPHRRVEVWSSAQGAGDEHDEAAGALAVERLPGSQRGQVVLTASHVDAAELVTRTAAAAAVVSMRLHPALLAAAQGTPTLLVLEDQKVGVLEGTPLEDLALTGNDRAALRSRLAALPGRPPPEVGPLRERLARTEAVLAAALGS